MATASSASTPFEILKKKKIEKSQVWDHFGFIKEYGQIDKKRVGCKLCQTILKYRGNTTSLIDHLKRKHWATK